MRTLKVALLIGTVLSTFVLSSMGFKWAAISQEWRGFLRGQVVGNLSGLANVLALTFLIRELSLHQAYAINAGLGFLLVEVVAAGLIFHEALGVGQWLGSLLVCGGVLMITLWR